MEKENLNENNPFGYFLSSAAWAIRSTYHTTLEASPGQLVFGRDMILPILFNADWSQISDKKRKRQVENNERENRKRVKHVYKVGDKCLLEKGPRVGKLDQEYSGPHEVLEVNTNGTIRIKRGSIRETVNIRRCVPYYERESSNA
jgi:hypothetical protein